MRFALPIECNNAAFHEDDGTLTDEARAAEIARVLRAAAEDIENGVEEGPLADTNGNTVGRFELLPETSR